MENVINVVTDVADALKKFAIKHPNKSGYNIFKVLEVENKEVLICRVLADLLNPRGSHGCKNLFLLKFIERVLPNRLAQACDSELSVDKEYPIIDKRRIDIVIRGQDFFIPIEVKIDAADQQSQCYDYYRFARDCDKKTQVIYITKHGTAPSEISMYSADKQDRLCDSSILSVSFENVIVEWLEEIIPMIENNDVRSVVKQYKSAVEDFCSEQANDENTCIAEVLLYNEEYFKSGLKISQAIDTAKAEIMQKMFAEFEAEFDLIAKKYGLERENRFCYYEYKQKATSAFYAHAESTYPGINYVVKNARISEGVELWFRLEVDYKLYAMFAAFDTKAIDETGEAGMEKDDIGDCHKLVCEIKKYLDFDKVQTKSWDILWKYIPTGSHSQTVGIDEVPDFKVMNEAAVRLCNEKHRKEFVKKSVGVIEREFLRLLK